MSTQRVAKQRKRSANDAVGIRVIHIPRTQLVRNPFRYVSAPPRMQVGHGDDGAESQTAQAVEDLAHSR